MRLFAHDSHLPLRRVLRVLSSAALLGLPLTAQTPPGAVVETHGQREGVPATTWRTVLAAGGKARIWAQTRYPDDLAKAQAIAAELGARIWPELTRRFWEPLPDEGFTIVIDGGTYELTALDTGQGPELDIYLVRFSGNQPQAVVEGGYSHAAYPGHSCGRNPRYLLLESNRPLGGSSGIGILNSLAHELMHAIADATPWLGSDCDLYRWFDEATATWAEHVVYRDSQSEHGRAVSYLMTTDQPLDFEANEHDPRHYGAYLFPLALMLHGREAALPAIWRRFATERPLNALASSLAGAGGKLEDSFELFMLDNWNRPSVDLYEKRDRLRERAPAVGGRQGVALSAGGRFERKIPLDLQYLASTYRHFQFAKEVEAITFENGLRGNPHARTWAIEKIDGAWQDARPLSDLAGVTWCRERPGENLEELVLAFGNTNWPKTGKESRTALRVRGEHELAAFGYGCTAWEGTTTAHFTLQSDGTSLTETSRATVRFEPDPGMEEPGRPVQYWRAVSGQVHWTAAMTGDCHGSFSGSFPIVIDADGNLMGTLQIYDAAETATPDPPGIRYWGGGAAPPAGQEPAFAWRCPGYEIPSTLTMALGWFGTATEGHPFPPGTKTLAGRYEAPDLPAGSRLTWTWDLHRAP